MADNKEEVLIDIRLQKSDNEKQIDNLTKSITHLTSANKELIAENKNLAKTGQENSTKYLENAKLIELNKQKISENTASRKGLIQAIIAEDNSIKGLNIQNANLIKQRNQITDKTEEGRAAIERINAKIDANNERIVKNSSLLEKQRFNIGNYASALDRLFPGMGAFVTGMEGMIKSSLAFIATPIGATLTAIAIVLIPIIKYLKETGEGQDILARETAKVNALLAIFNRYIIDTGKALLGFPSEVENNGLVKFFKIVVDNTPNIVTLTRLLYNLIPDETRKDLEEAAQRAAELADALDDLKDSEENYGIEAAKTSNEVKRLLLQAKNRQTTEEDRIALLDKALSLEAQAVIKRTAFAQDELSILVEKNRKLLEGAGIAQKADETQETFVENNIDRIRDFNEELAKSLIDSVIKLEEARSSGISIEEKAQNQIDALLEKAEEREKKRRDDELKSSEDARKQRLEDYEARKVIIDSQLELQAKAGEKEVEINKSIKDKLATDYETFKAREKKADEKRLKEAKIVYENERSLAHAKMNLLGQLGAVIGQLAGRNRALAVTAVLIEKAAAVGQIIMNTQEANAKAIKASPLTFGQPWVGINTASGALGVIATVASSIQAIQQINSAKGFATSGKITTGPPIRRSNGDNVLITAKKGEVVLNETHQAMLGGDATFRKIGVPGFATSGIVGNETRIAARDAVSQLDINQMAQLINQVQTVLVLQDYEAKKLAAEATQRVAKIL